jgi:hypothetical protein
MLQAESAGLARSNGAAARPEARRARLGVRAGCVSDVVVASVSVTDRLLRHGQVHLPPGRAPGEFRLYLVDTAGGRRRTGCPAAR